MLSMPDKFNDNVIGSHDCCTQFSMLFYVTFDTGEPYLSMHFYVCVGAPGELDLCTSMCSGVPGDCADPKF